MTEQTLRRQHEERQGVLVKQLCLAAQEMEVLSGRRAVDEAQVDSGGSLQNALWPGAGMLGPLSLVAVRQEKHERRLQSPFRSGRRHELVEDDLRAVDEVTVLRFPDHQMR